MSNTVEQKHPRTTDCTGEGRRLHPARAIPSPTPALLSAKREHAGQEVSSPRKEKQGEHPALQGERRRLQPSGGTTHRSCFCFIPPRPAKLRGMETAVNEEQKQGLPGAARRGSTPGSLPVQLASLQRGPGASTAAADLTSFCPQVHVCRYWLPESFPALSPLPAMRAWALPQRPGQVSLAV